MQKITGQKKGVDDPRRLHRMICENRHIFLVFHTMISVATRHRHPHYQWRERRRPKYPSTSRKSNRNQRWGSVTSVQQRANTIIDFSITSASEILRQTEDCHWNWQPRLRGLGWCHWILLTEYLRLSAYLVLPGKRGRNVSSGLAAKREMDSTDAIVSSCCGTNRASLTPRNMTAAVPRKI